MPKTRGYPKHFDSGAQIRLTPKKKAKMDEENPAIARQTRLAD